MKKQLVYQLNQTCWFKQWGGKGYNAFVSMNKVVRIAILGVIYLCCIGNTEVLAQNDTTKFKNEVNLSEIEVTAQRSPALYSEIGRVVNVISRKEIEKLPVQSVQDLLKYAMGVDVRQRGPLGVQADISIRGGSFDQVMILLNGINITDPQTGHLSLNLPVNIQSIERIEILEGPGSRVHGPNAFSGAINFITGTKNNNNVTANAMAGQYGLDDVGVNTTFISGDMKNYVAANVSSSDGYMENTDFFTYNIFYHGSLNLQGNKLDLQVGYTDKEFGANSFYTAAYPNQFEQNKTTFASLAFASKGKIKIKPSVYWRGHQDRFELFRDYEDAASWYGGHNYHLTDVFGTNINTVIPWSLGKTAVGGDLRSEHVWSNVLGYDMSKSIDVPGEPDGMFTKTYSRSNASFFLEHTYSYERLTVSAGVMANYNSGLGFGIEYFPGVDVSYWFTDKLKMIASYNQSLRMPTFTDLFYEGRTNDGNPNLKPEEAYTYETGLKYLDQGVNVTLIGFYRQGKNMIDWGRLESDEGGKYTTSNINKINTLGVEASVVLNFKKIIGNELFVQRVGINYAWLNQDKESIPGYTSVYVFNYLKNKLNVSVDHKIYSHLGATWNFLYQDREGGFTDAVSSEYKEYEPFWLADLRLHWTKPKYTIYVEASNLLDKTYVDFGHIAQPGRWVRAGVKVNMDF
ncbi:TonB-dependent receptor [Labilibacter sediminis]|nr:TonB-dependent receptor [Labilibacter sediminis]